MRYVLILIGFLFSFSNISSLSAAGPPKKLDHYYHYRHSEVNIDEPPILKQSKVKHPRPYNPADLKEPHHTWPYSTAYLFYLRMGQTTSSEGGSPFVNLKSALPSAYSTPSIPSPPSAPKQKWCLDAIDPFMFTKEF